jgi:histidyl-tRNA synthetase
MPVEIPSTSLPVAAATPVNLYLSAACRHYVVTAVRAAFESHSAVERSGQILHRSVANTSGQILLMDREGRLLDLRRDLRSDLILTAGSGRFFQIGTVFRAIKGIPRHIVQGDFDIVGSEAKAPYADAEVFSLQLTLMDMFPILGEARLQIGHVTLTSAVMDICHVPEDVRPVLQEFAKDVHSSLGSQVDLFRQFLSRYSSSVNVTLLISIVSHRGSPIDGIVHLRNHFVHNREALAALGEWAHIMDRLFTKLS